MFHYSKLSSIFAFGIFIVLYGCKLESEEIKTFEINFVNPISVSTPVFIDIEPSLGGDLVLIKKTDGLITEITAQRFKDRLWFIVEPNDGPLTRPIYTIKNRPGTEIEYKNLSATKKNGNLQLSLDNNPVLQYKYEINYPPDGIDSIYKKSGYIHPILTPNGDTLSRVNPPDHYHHYGLWGPWTHTRIDTMRVDFWNLGEGQGTVLFKKFETTTSGPNFSSFNAVQEHLDFKTKDEPQIALNENLNVTLWNLYRTDRFMFDYTTTFNSPLENGILFEAYRYGGGIGMRFNERWQKDNCTVLTSEGKNRLEADGSNARWAIISGESNDGKGTNGILFMSHPENRMHPEPMRVWPMDANGGRGDMFFEFCPIRHEEWKIEPKKDYKLKYRMVVFDGILTSDDAEAYWQVFANPPQIRIVSK
nr:hypothetical protein [uncultured bacterium]